MRTKTIKTMNKTKLMLVLLASLALGACSSSGDEDSDSKEVLFTEAAVTEAPQWAMDWSNNQERPSWTEPDASLYENWTILKVQLEETLLPYSSAGDLMALFVNGELRALASPAVPVGSDQTATGKFLMKAYGNESGTETVNMSLQYYSQTLKHLFTLSGDINLNSDETTGIDEAFIPEFTLGPSKYLVVMVFNGTDLLAKAGVKAAKGDCLAAFVGDECRGVCASPADNLSWVVYGRAVGESLTVKYYQASIGKIYTFLNALQIK